MKTYFYDCSIVIVVNKNETVEDKAMKIKEDVVDNLNLTHSTWQGEKRQRELLQEHIRSITDLVRKLDRDIKVCVNSFPRYGCLKL